MPGKENSMTDQAPEITHLDEQGRLRMVDVSNKEETERIARACAVVVTSPGTLDRILSGEIPKGNVLEAARLAGIMAAKRTWDLIPLCHPVRLTGIRVDFEPMLASNEIRIVSQVKTRDRTGVEMEALVAAAHAGLTIIDMCKAIDRHVEIHNLRVTFKTGGKSGTFHAAPTEED